MGRGTSRSRIVIVRRRCAVELSRRLNQAREHRCVSKLDDFVHDQRVSVGGQVFHLPYHAHKDLLCVSLRLNAAHRISLGSLARIPERL